MNCLNCQKETSNPKFCCKSCSATFTNKQYPKRKPTKFCKSCQISINSRSRYCTSCKDKKVKKLLIDCTLQEIIYDNHHRSSAFALVRSRARELAKKLLFKQCQNCGYDKHVEICHIKPISSFPLDTLLSIINSNENLIPLCPNCHWEFDNGLITISKN